MVRQLAGHLLPLKRAEYMQRLSGSPLHWHGHGGPDQSGGDQGPYQSGGCSPEALDAQLCAVHGFSEAKDQCVVIPDGDGLMLWIVRWQSQTPARGRVGLDQ